MTKASFAEEQLKALVNRIERLEEEIKAMNGDKSEAYQEAKAVGFDVKVLRKVVAARRKSADARAEEDAIFDMYMAALSGPSKRLVRARVENIEEFASHNPETGEIIETGSVGATDAVTTTSGGNVADEMPSPDLSEESRERQTPNPAPSMGTVGSKPEASPLEADMRLGMTTETAAITSEPAPSTVPDDAVGEPAPAALVSPPFSSDEEPELPSFCDRHNWVDGCPPAKAEAA